MGLCKCPKRKVTNLFCFEHRVNVCESCLVANHHKCIVQSYLQWLQDSDYNPNCRLCGTLLAARDTVRLVCYDLFHWSCLAARARALPPRTAPAGYRCPSCGGPLFPPPNLEGPVAAALRARLAAAPWARPGLGLPLIEEAEAAPELEPEPEPEAAADTWGSFGAPPAAAEAPPSPPGAHAIVHVGTETLVLHGSAPRKPLGGRESRDPPDRDEDKYRRRRVLRCWPRGRPPRPPLLVLALGGALAFVALLVLLARLGRAAAANDPALEPLRNPHLRVGP